MVSVSDPDGKMLDFLIIDGQQRLTTVSLLLLAMYNLMQEGLVVPEIPNLSQRIYEEYLVDKWQTEKRINSSPTRRTRRPLSACFPRVRMRSLKLFPGWKSSIFPSTTEIIRS
ncbi:hypothetical protein B5F55_11295 [Anaerotruncus colihominis]|nr:hypothetical protein B5F55_11295 [Anaerotruncus colihominis]